MDKLQFGKSQLEIKSIDEKGMIEGYASVFGNIDQGYDIVEKGAFKKTIKNSGKKLPVLFNHNQNMQIGWDIGEMKEDDYGLLVKGKLSLEVEKAKDLYVLMKDGEQINGKSEYGMSIGYYTIRAEKDKENPVIRRLKELKLVEYSLVTFPMNDLATVTAAKSNGDLIEDELLDFAETAKKFFVDLGYSQDSAIDYIRSVKLKNFSQEELQKAIARFRFSFKN